jgi:hypothetical protein
MRLRLTQRLGGIPRKHTRLMLSVWSLMHGTAMLMIRGGATGPLRTQMIHSCLDAVEAIVAQAARSKGKTYSGPKWPASLILGEAAHSKVAEGEMDDNVKSSSKPVNRPKQKPSVGLHAVRSGE